MKSAAVAGGPARDGGSQFERRTVLGGAAALVACACHGRAWGQGLLDPSVLQRPATPAPSPLTRHSPSYASGMAQSTLSALISLASAYSNTANKLSTLSRQEKELRDEVDRRIKNKELELEDYRQGLFCSGCNRTRTDILSKGEQFPHAGQTIIRPTQAQIDAKERELQASIDRASASLTQVVADQRKEDDNLSRIQKEIWEGGMLWRSAVTFEEAIINQRDGDAERTFQAKREPITARTEELEELETTVFEPDERIALANEAVLLTSRLTMLDQQRSTERRGNQLAVSNANRRAQDDSDRFRSALMSAAARITESKYRGFLEINTNLLSKTDVAWTTGGGRETGGRFFHMGDYGPETVTSLHPRVQQFLNDAGLPFRNGPAAYYPSVRDETELLRDLGAKLRIAPPIARSDDPDEQF